jgi:PTS system nitrogen regulatory IIA component
MKNNDRLDEILTLGEVANYLKLSEKTVLRMVHEGKIPCTKIASQWRFVKTVIDDWLISKMRVVPKNDLTRLIKSGSEIVPISRFLRNDFIVMEIRPESKKGILDQLIEPLVRSGIVGNRIEFLNKLMYREQMASTAIGKGIAIPHIRNPEENSEGGPYLVIGICKGGADFDALDKDKTFLFFLLYTDSEIVHLRVMGKLSRLLNDEKAVFKLIRARNKDEVIKIVLMKDQEAIVPM